MLLSVGAVSRIFPQFVCNKAEGAVLLITILALFSVPSSIVLVPPIYLKAAMVACVRLTPHLNQKKKSPFISDLEACSLVLSACKTRN